MSVICEEIMDAMEEWAPAHLAESWDHVGLMVGSRRQEVQKIWTTLDVTLPLVQKAAESGVNLIVSHHPLLFKPLAAIDTDCAMGKLVKTLLTANIAVFSAHTNLDIAAGGVNDTLASVLKLQNVQPLVGGSREKLLKLAVYVPKDYAQNVFQAITAAGAGWIGKYSHCTFQTDGTGTFLPLEGAQPFLGQLGSLEKAAEVRIETVLPEKIRQTVIKAMLAAHPYEEVAYDLYPLINQGMAFGLGRIGETQPQSLGELADWVKEKLHVAGVSVTGDLQRRVRKVAVCGGAGFSLYSQAIAGGADTLVTGDVKYHDALTASELGLNVIDAGHFPTEQPVVPILAEYLKKRFPELTVETNDWQTNVFHYC